MKTLLINKKDLIHNIEIIKEIANKEKKCEIIGVVKGNGYGLDLIEFSKILIDNGIETLAVSTVEEAIKLRQAGIKATIMMLSSTCIDEEIKLLIENNIILTIGSRLATKKVNEIATELGVKVKVQLKIDTGFGRYGFVYNDVETLITTIKEALNIEIVGTFSHFSMSFEKKKSWTKKQFDIFMNVVESLNEAEIDTGKLHICNSSAFLKYPEMYLDSVRVGSAFLGRIIIPNTYGLKKIGILKSNISEIKELPRGYNIGYSNVFKTKKETKIAIIPVGYRDGYNVKSCNDTYRFIDKLRYTYNTIKDFMKDKKLKVTIQGKKCIVLGKIGMYHIAIDITDQQEIEINDEVYLDINPLYVDSNIRREYC